MRFFVIFAGLRDFVRDRQRTVRGCHWLRRVSHARAPAPPDSGRRTGVGDHAGGGCHVDRRRRAHRAHVERRGQLHLRRAAGHGARCEADVHLRAPCPTPAVLARVRLLSGLTDYRDVDARRQRRRRRRLGHGSGGLADDDARWPRSLAGRTPRRLRRRRRCRRRLRGGGPRSRCG